MDKSDESVNRLADRRNLYLCSQNVNNGYDTYDAIIVAAWTEDEARTISPSWGYAGPPEWAPPDKVSVEYIGLAAIGLPSGIVLSSFNAG